MTFSRDQLVRAFPNNPRMVAEFEALDALVNEATAQAAKLKDELAAIAAALPEGAFQPFSELLEAIAAVPDDLTGAIERISLDEVTVRSIDTEDDACLVTRPHLVSFVGTGASGARPALSVNRRAIYFDTTLGGKPVFWNGAGWVDATGAAV